MGFQEWLDVLIYCMYKYMWIQRQILSKLWRYIISYQFVWISFLWHTYPLDSNWEFSRMIESVAFCYPCRVHLGGVKFMVHPWECSVFLSSLCREIVVRMILCEISVLKCDNFPLTQGLCFGKCLIMHPGQQCTCGRALLQCKMLWSRTSWHAKKPNDFAAIHNRFYF